MASDGKTNGLHDPFRKSVIDSIGDGESFDLYLIENADRVIEAQDGEVETFKEAQTAGAALRIVRDGRVGFSYATLVDPTPEAVARLIENARAATRVIDPEPLFSLAQPTSAPPAASNEFDPSLEKRSHQEKIELALALEKAAREYDPRIRAVRGATYKESIGAVRYVASTGLDLEHRSTFASVSLMAVGEEKEQSEIGWDMEFSPFIERLDPWKVGRMAAENAIMLLGAQPMATMKCPVILDNAVACEFLEILSDATLYENVFKRKSGLIGKLGQQVAAESVQVFDDGLRSGGISTCPFDGEGTPSRKTQVIENGVLKTYLYDRLNAQRDTERNGESTGNALRGGVTHPPSSGTRDFYIPNGDRSVEDLVSGIDKGLIITEVMGAHTANPITGEFSLGATGVYVEGGKRRHPVRNFAVAGSIFDLFAGVIGIGNDQRFFGDTGSPSLLIDSLSIGGS